MSFGLTEVEWIVILTSLKVALWATLVTLPVAVGFALALARRPFWGQSLLNVFVHLPLVLPPVVTGYALLMVLGRQGVIGRWLFETFGVTLAFTQTGAVIAAGIMALPLMVRAIRLGREAVSDDLLQAASTLGASPWRQFLTITLPLMAPSVLVATVLGWAKAMGEFGATITFVAAIPGVTETIPSAIFTALQIPDGSSAITRLVAVSIVLSVGALAVSEWLARRMKTGGV